MDRGRALERLIDVALEVNLRAAPPSGVGGDDQLGFGVVDAIGERLGGESSEHHRMNRADARAREHRDRGLGNQRHVDGDAIAFLDAEALERVGGAADFIGEHLIGQDARVAGLAFPDESDLVAAPVGQMAIEAIVGGVDLAADEPFSERKIPFEDFIVRLEP